MFKYFIWLMLQMQFKDVKLKMVDKEEKNLRIG